VSAARSINITYWQVGWRLHYVVRAVQRRRRARSNRAHDKARRLDASVTRDQRQGARVVRIVAAAMLLCRRMLRTYTRQTPREEAVYGTKSPLTKRLAAALARCSSIPNAGGVRHVPRERRDGCDNTFCIVGQGDGFAAQPCALLAPR
jgi:hypothetical protein